MRESKEKIKKASFCPYCDADSPSCQPCEVTIFYCPKCRQSLPRETKVCPHCGAKIIS